MANNVSTNPEYNGQVIAPSAEYTFGSAKNDTLPGDQTGTPRVASELNDLFGFLQALLNAAAIVPSGSPDTVLLSQYLTSIRQVISELGGTMFADIATLKTGVALDGSTVDFAKLAGKTAVVHTRWRDSTDRDNGATYLIRTDLVYQAQFGGAPDGVQDFYVGGGTDHVAQMDRGAMARLRIGTDPLIGAAAERDAAYVGRTLVGLTDCHAFTDRTVLTAITDAGTYGAFDAVTKVQGNHAQSHLFSFQDRSIYDGDGAGSIGSWGNIIWPELTNNGTVNNRYGWWLKDINNTGGGTVDSNIGLFIEDLSEATSNVAINLAQSTGFAVFAPNAGAWEIGGDVDINASLDVTGVAIHTGNLYAGNGFKAGGLANATPPLGGTAITVDKDGNAFQALVDVNSIGLALGVVGDEEIQFITNGATRVKVGDLASGYDFGPTSSTQNLGNPSFLWKEVFAVNGTINTSDERLKTFIGPQSDAEKRVAVKLQAALKSFKWDESIGREDAGGSKARIHFGIGVQTLGAIFKSEGLDPSDYAMYCYDEWADKFDLVCTNEGAVDEGVEPVTRQKTETREVVRKTESVELVDGKYVLVVAEVPEVAEVPLFETHAVYDAKGEPVVDDKSYYEKDKAGQLVKVERFVPRMHKVPVMETVELPYSRPRDRKYEQKLIAAAGNRYGIRLDQVVAFILASVG